MKTIKTFLGIVDTHTIVVTLLALVSTHIAIQMDLSAEMPADIISIAVIFPIVFSINAAYMRREEALRHFASLRSNASGLRYAFRDWAREPVAGLRDRGYAAIDGCFDAIQSYLQGSDSRQRDPDPVYERYSELSESIEGLRDSGVSTSEMSRANQYLRLMMLDFELLRNIASYRTPVPLRAYSHVFLNTFPILVGPYFASLSRDYYLAMGYAVAALYSLVLVSLDNIQEELEDPFDADGLDDIRLDEARSFGAAG